MGVPMRFNVSLFALAMIVSGCDDNHPLTATATVANVNGHLVEETTSAKDLERLKALTAKLAAIDEKYPPPEYDRKAQLYKVTGVRSDGVVLLDSGTALRFDGITCSPEGVDNISKLLLEASARVAFNAADAGASPTPAEIWLVDQHLPARHVLSSQ